MGLRERLVGAVLSLKPYEIIVVGCRFNLCGDPPLQVPPVGVVVYQAEGQMTSALEVGEFLPLQKVGGFVLDGSSHVSLSGAVCSRLGLSLCCVMCGERSGAAVNV